MSPTVSPSNQLIYALFYRRTSRMNSKHCGNGWQEQTKNERKTSSPINVGCSLVGENASSFPTGFYAHAAELAKSGEWLRRL